MQIGGIQKTSFLDYPDKISAIVFTQGCNFRCGYCHNPELTVMRKKPDDFGFFEFLQNRKGKLDGVVITGGEPCLQSDLHDFIKQIRGMGFCVKLDTNGSMPDVLKQVIFDTDYVAMDIKAPLAKYSEITNVNADTEKIKQSIDIIMNSGVDYEFRTTVIKSQLDVNDFKNIGKLIKGAKKYYLQKFLPSKILDKSLNNEQSYSDFTQILTVLKKYVEEIYVR